MKRALFLIPLALVFSACGPLPVTVDLLPALRDAGLDQQAFHRALDVPQNTDLSTIGNLALNLPSDDGLTVEFPAPNLPASPASLVLDFKARVNYNFDCVSGLGGTLRATGYLAPEPPPWDAPLSGLATEITLEPSGGFVLEGRAALDRDQIQAILSGQATLGIRIELEGLTGQTENCTPTVSGSYEIERAVIEARFL